MAADTPDGEKFVNEDWFTAFMRARRNEIVSLGLCALGVILVVGVITHHPLDPSPNAATGSATSNALGPWGAAVADFVLQWLGWGGAAMGMMLFGWGVTMLVRGARRRGPKLVSLRVAAGVLALMGLMTAASALPIPATWPFAVGLGGAIGDAAHSELTMWLGAVLLPYPGILAGLIGLAAAVIGAVAGYGVTPDDVADAADTAARMADTLAERARRAVETLTRRVNHEPVKLQPLSTNESRQLPPSQSTAVEPVSATSPAAGPHARFTTTVDDATPAPAQEVAAAHDTEPAGEPGGLRGLFGGRQRAAARQEMTYGAPAAYALPGLDLLAPPEPRSSQLDEAELENRAAQLESVLTDFGVKGQVLGARPGPVITQFEFEPAPGVRSARIIGLADDIARSLSAPSARVAVVPGRNVIGIELPSPERETVFLRSLLDSDAYANRKLGLPMALGENIVGEPVVVDLARMPHLLVAGATGSGKSVGINAMILSLLYRLPPDRCRFILVDPKMTEMSLYANIPHLLAPVIVEPRKAVAALKWACSEMERRYELMMKLGTRNITGFNRKVEDAIAHGRTELELTVQKGFDQDTGQPQVETEHIPAEIMPYIVIVIDEMADLMQVAGKDIEALVQRLAQMARAAGIHLITATQRPSVDVITGTIKANFPERISYWVAQKADSRTILGEQGAEQLLRPGDLLYLGGATRVQRLHGPYVSEGEIERIASFFRAQGAPDYVEGITDDPDEALAPPAPSSNAAPNSTEDLYDRALFIVTSERKASTSFLQRKLSIGYNRAATIMEQLEENGIVSEAKHNGRRDILAPAPTMAGEA